MLLAVLSQQLLLLCGQLGGCSARRLLRGCVSIGAGPLRRRHVAFLGQARRRHAGRGLLRRLCRVRPLKPFERLRLLLAVLRVMPRPAAALAAVVQVGARLSLVLSAALPTLAALAALARSTLSGACFPFKLAALPLQVSNFPRFLLLHDGGIPLLTFGQVLLRVLQVHVVPVVEKHLVQLQLVLASAQEVAARHGTVQVFLAVLHVLRLVVETLVARLAVEGPVFLLHVLWVLPLRVVRTVSRRAPLAVRTSPTPVVFVVVIVVVTILPLLAPVVVQTPGAGGCCLPPRLVRFVLCRLGGRRVSPVGRVRRRVVVPRRRRRVRRGQVAQDERRGWWRRERRRRRGQGCLVAGLRLAVRRLGLAVRVGVQRSGVGRQGGTRGRGRIALGRVGGGIIWHRVGGVRGLWGHGMDCGRGRSLPAIISWLIHAVNEVQIL
eukprot:Rhum_TRINITY_DN14199_c2_g1::Rhum_TRINITY_DN14199_c2_g1_i1::g.71892::m.71892